MVGAMGVVVGCGGEGSKKVGRRKRRGRVQRRWNADGKRERRRSRKMSRVVVEEMMGVVVVLVLGVVGGISRS